MMTNLGKWLGEENGKSMLSAVFTNDSSKEQARAAVTTYCIIFGIEVDTAQWDNLMRWIYEFYNSWFDDFEDMDNFMCELLV